MAEALRRSTAEAARPPVIRIVAAAIFLRRSEWNVGDEHFPLLRKRG